MSVFEWLKPRKLAAERDRALADRDSARQERDKAISERDKALRDRDRALVERDQALRERREARAERDQAIAGQSRAIVERDQAYTARDAALAERGSLESIQAQLTQIQQVASLAAKNGAARRKEIRVLFVVHFLHAWKTLEGIYRAMAGDGDFEPVVVTIDHRFDDTRDFEGEGYLHEELERAGVPHLRWGSPNGSVDRKLVTNLAPDVVFLQTHWDGSFPEPLRALNLGFARTCYVHYGQEITAGGWDDAVINSEYVLSCWRVFCSSRLVRDLYQKRSKLGALSVVVTGDPKLDHLYAIRNQPGVWPVRGSRRKFRLLWSVHHSITSEGYRYGTFLENHRDMLEWARRDPDIEIVLTFHHLFFAKMAEAGACELDEFLAAWNALPNTGIYNEADIGPVFAASDAHVTDTVSFLVEYQMTGKPLISFESSNPYPFNEVGDRIMKGVYRVRSVSAAADIIDRFRHKKLDPFSEERKAIRNELMPYPEGASRRIMTEIREALRAERGEADRPDNEPAKVATLIQPPRAPARRVPPSQRRI
jgi:hypothetical protein